MFVAVFFRWFFPRRSPLNSPLRGLICFLGLVLLAGCGGGADADGRKLQWHGFLYDRQDWTDRGTFEADLRTDGYRIWGSVRFTGLQVESIKVEGKVREHISGNNHRYTDVDLSSDDGISISFLEFGTGLGDDTTMSGTLSDENLSKEYSIYTVAGGGGMLSVVSGLKADFSSLSSVAVADDGTIWAYGKLAGTASIRLHRVGSDGNIADSRDLASMGSCMTWGTDRLWFVTGEAAGETLSSYLCSDFSSDGQVVLRDLSAFDRVSTIAYHKGQVLAVTGMVVNKVIVIDPATGGTLSSWTGDYGDLHGLAVCGDLRVASQWDRSGYLNSILVYDTAGNLQRSFVAPGSGADKLACDSSFLYTASSDGWILKTPISELSGS
jgi:hypothetical protein